MDVAGSGKSNLLEAIALIRSAPQELVVPLREGGGVVDWLFKDGFSKATPTATLEAVVERPDQTPLRYRLGFTGVSHRLDVTDERVEDEYPQPGQPEPYFYFGYENGRPMLNRAGEGNRYLKREDIDPQRSILSQRYEPDLYPEIAFLANQFKAIRLYRDWEFGRYAAPRLPQRADLPNDFLQDDCANLGLILNSFGRHPAARKRLLGHLQRLYDGIKDPPLVCIEEPELGLHPDLIPGLADLLLEASEATQLVVTTHSASLVDAFHTQPECVVVCEKEDGSTCLSRLDPSQLGVWLEQYRLGQLWTRGDLGGTRW
ncbi:AAA family ATPase [bacterium]|nr:AAA family ATPase [bacterium]